MAGKCRVPFIYHRALVGLSSTWRWEDLARPVDLGESAPKDASSLRRGSTRPQSTLSPTANDLPEVPRNNPCQIIVSRAYAIYRPARLLNVSLAQHPARAFCLQLAARTSPKSDSQDGPGWSYPISESGDGRSYSCRRLLFWSVRRKDSPMQGLARLEDDETATQEVCAKLAQSITAPSREYDHRT